MNDTDMVAVNIDSFTTNNPASIEKILKSRKRKRAKFISRGTAKAMARIFDSANWYNLTQAPALDLKYD